MTTQATTKTAQSYARIYAVEGRRETGMENANDAPGPSFASAQIRPWCLSTIDRLTDNPIPMPPLFVV